MRIEELLEQLLFENFNQLKNLYDAMMEEDYITAMGRLGSEVLDKEAEIERRARRMGIQDTHPVDVYSFLMRTRMKMTDQNGNPNTQFSDVNFWVSAFNKVLKIEPDPSMALETFLNSLLATMTEYIDRREFSGNKDNYDVIHKGDNWILFEPHHKAASCRLGSGTKWCISSRGEENYFDGYNENSDVYIIHTRNDKYSIIVRDGEVIEVQDSDNERKQQHFDVHREFFIILKNDGVDIEVLFDKIGVDSGRYFQPNYNIDEIDISNDSESIPAIDGFTVRLFELDGVFSKRDPMLPEGVVKTNFTMPFYVITLPDAAGDTYFVHEERKGARFLDAVYFDIMETAEREGILETRVSVLDDMVQAVVKEEITQEFDSMFDTKNLTKSGNTMLEVALGEHSE